MKRTWFLLMLAAVPPVSAATPSLVDLYAVGELGLVQFSMAEGKVTGKVRSSSQCVYAPDTTVMSGVFEGNVFVGSVTLCQDGGGCPATRTYPMMGVFHGGSLSAFIHLDPGCSSPALEGRSLFVRPATQEERLRFESPTSAAALAQKQNKVDPVALAAEAVLEGNRLLQENRIGQAREKFRQAMESDASRWEAFNGFGLTEFRLGNAQSSLEYYEKAMTAAQARRATPGAISQIHYNRACSQTKLGDRKGAVASLRQAVKLGGATSYLEALTDDSDLEALRTDADFKRLVAETLVAAKKKTR